MATRDRITSSSTPPVAGATYADNVAGLLKILLDKMVLPVTSPAGTNTYTGTVDPSFDGDGLVSGMVFSIAFPNTNTSTTCTLNINSVGAKTIKEHDGSAPIVGALVSGSRHLMYYDGTDFRLVAPTFAWIDNQIAVPTVTPPTMQAFGSSGTWTKPSGCTKIKVTVVGGGGGGSDDGLGGHSGAGRISYVDVTSISSATITVGAGGAGSGGGSNTAGGLSRYADGTNTITANGATSGSNATSNAAISSSSGANIETELAIVGGIAHGDHGAGTAWGTGGAGTGTTGQDGKGYGCGGGKGTTTGGDGAAGVVFIEEYYS